jgi:aminoglycoside 6'-N-acetyltransferase
MVKYLFEQKHHHRLVIDPSVENTAAIACYARVGFKPVGVMRAYERRADGTWSDGLLMDMLRADGRPK